MDTAHAFGGGISAHLAAAHDSLAQAEALARRLHPGVDTWQITKATLGELAGKDLDHRGWIKRPSHELPHLAHIVPRLPQLAMRRLIRHHDHHRTGFDTALWAHEMQCEYQSTRVLWWACATCVAALGIAALWLGH